MKTRILTAMIPLLVTGALATDTHARAHSVKEAQATAPELQLSKKSPDIFELKNGMRVFYYESDRVPLVTVRAVVRAGDIWEPADRMGVANLTGRMMRAGGSLAWPADTMDEELDFLAARLSSGIGDEMGNVTLNVLSENLDDALAIFADLMLHPRFDDTKMSVEKGLIKEDIRRENDNPIQVAFREYDKLIWGEDHPRARTPTGESVDALTVEDLQAFHAAFFQPGNVSFGVAGDVSKRSIRRKLNQLFGDWKGPEVVFPATPPVPERTPRVALAVKEVPQTTVLLGHLGPMETDPMRYSGQVMMNILGSGGFTSYIVDRVRNDEGLAYFAGGFLDFGMLDPGYVVALALSKTETTCEATKLILEQIERIQSIPVTEEELARARDGILNARAFDYDSGKKIVSRLMNLEYYSLPDDHYERGFAEIARVDQAAVQEAANALLDPSMFSFLAVGNAEGFDCAWQDFADQNGVDLIRIELD